MQDVLSEILSSASYEAECRDEGCHTLSELVSVSRHGRRFVMFSRIMLSVAACEYSSAFWLMTCHTDVRTQLEHIRRYHNLSFFVELSPARSHTSIHKHRHHRQRQINAVAIESQI